MMFCGTVIGGVGFAGLGCSTANAVGINNKAKNNITFFIFSPHKSSLT